MKTEKAKYLITAKIYRYNRYPKKYVLARGFRALGFSDVRQAIICIEELNGKRRLEQDEYRVEYLSRNPRIKEISVVNSAEEFLEKFTSYI